MASTLVTMIAPSVTAVAGIGLLLGLRHAFEPDHLAAVSTLATRQSRLWPAARLGIAWGFGHTAAVGAVSLAVVGVGVELPERLWPLAELGVAAMLVALGATVVWRYARGRWHMHRHTHGAAPHLHLHSHAADPAHGHRHVTGDLHRSLGFGLLHGLAGSAAVIVLLVAAAPTAALRIAYVGAFGLGTIVGMLGVTLALGGVVRLASGRGERWATVLHVSAAAGSIVVGCLLAVEVLSH
jgi:ABC-type nickel/cobalt efflux system permease component RcnA